jgi:hypothetical protein
LSLPIRGTLLGIKAVSEHELPNEMGASSAIDLNQASMILTQCASDPDLYATEYGAGCETMVELLSKAKVAWDMRELSQ